MTRDRFRVSVWRVASDETRGLDASGVEMVAVTACSRTSETRGGFY
jgi:hypothetical protein